MMRNILWIGGMATALVVGAPLLARRPRLSVQDWNRINARAHLHEMSYAFWQFFENDEPAEFPDAKTATRVKEETSTPLTLGSGSSNQLFRQLLVSGRVKEEIFYFPGAGAVKPDNDFHDDAHALAPGECGFACVAGLPLPLDPYAPVVMAPLVKGKLEFDPKPLAGKAIFLFPLKNDVETMPIGPDGHVRVNGMDIFDRRQPFWHGVAPDIKWQE